ncbi:MAG: hypothetical protein QOG68_648 [Solirubrobacteraceae bacterium]|nr:hypothetical protein [Solirubrobacteraceae bacterium]
MVAACLALSAPAARAAAPVARAAAPAAQAAAPAAFTEVAGSPFQTNAGSVSSLAFSPSGRWLAVGNSSSGNLDVTAVSAAGVLQQLPSSPLMTNTGPVSSVAFSPSSALVATANLGSQNLASHGTVSVFTLGATGSLTPVPGSPFATGAGPSSVAFSPDGGLLAVANKTDGTVSLFSVSGGGALAPAPGSPFATGPGPASLAFSPTGTLLAVANSRGYTVSVFSLFSGGVLVPVPGSPFATTLPPTSLAFSPTGELLAVATSAAGVSAFSVSPAGALAPVPGSPFPTPLPVTSVAFGSSSLLAATEYASGGLGQTPGSLAVFSVSAAGTLASLPGSPFATGTNPHSLAFSRSGAMIAVGNDSGGGTVSTFAAPPQATISSSGGGRYALGQMVPTAFACADSPYGPGVAACVDSNSALAPRGYLDTSAVGAQTYVVNAMSRDGLTGVASITYTVVSGCAGATGRVAGTRLGPVTLGMTRSAVRNGFGLSPARALKHSDYFCLAPTGIWVGYAPQRVGWIYTANRRYAINGVRAGSSVSSARSRLKLATPFHVGANDWYFTPSGPATAILEARRGVVTAVGITSKQLTSTRGAQRALLTSIA